MYSQRKLVWLAIGFVVFLGVLWIHTEEAHAQDVLPVNTPAKGAPEFVPATKPIDTPIELPINENNPPKFTGHWGDVRWDWLGDDQNIVIRAGKGQVLLPGSAVVELIYKEGTVFRTVNITAATGRITSDDLELSPLDHMCLIAVNIKYVFNDDQFHEWHLFKEDEYRTINRVCGLYNERDGAYKKDIRRAKRKN